MEEIYNFIDLHSDNDKILQNIINKCHEKIYKNLQKKTLKEIIEKQNDDIKKLSIKKYDDDSETITISITNANNDKTIIFKYINMYRRYTLIINNEIIYENEGGQTYDELFYFNDKQKFIKYYEKLNLSKTSIKDFHRFLIDAFCF